MVALAEGDLDELQDREQSAGNNKPSSATTNQSSSMADLREAESTVNTLYKKRRFSSFIRGAKKHKNLLMGGGAGAGGLLIIIVVLFFIASFLKIPGLAQNITQLEFIRLSRQSAYAITRVASETLAVQTASDDPQGTSKSLRELIQDKYASEKPLLNKMSNLALDKVSDNLKLSDDIKFNYTKTKYGNLLLDSVELGDELIKVPAQRGFLRSFIPEFLDIPYIRSQATFADQFVPVMRTALGATGDSEVANLIRGGVISKIVRSELGIDLKVWSARRLLAYAKDSPTDATLQVNRDTYNAETLDGTAPAALEGTAVVDDLNNAIQDANTATNQVVSDPNPAELAQAITPQNDGFMSRVGDAINNALQAPVWKSIARTLGVVTDISVTSCIIYEGSVEQAGPTINLGTQEQVRSYTTLASMADAQETGSNSPGLAQAVGGWNTKLGEVGTSNPYLRASGQNVDTLTTAISAEAGPMQNFTLLNALFGNTGAGGAMANVVNTVANKACPIMTHPLTAIGLALANVVFIIVSTIPSGGSAPTGEIAADAAVDGAAEGVSSNVVQRVTGAVLERIASQGISTTMKRVGLFLFKEGVVVAGVSALTILAKLFVIERSGSLYNGLEQGADFANEADAGANILAGENARLMGGRPLTCSEVAANDQLDTTQLADDTRAEGFTDRYLALSNPNSLLMRSANMVYSGTSGLLQGSTVNVTALMQTPLDILGYALRPILGIASADAPCNQYYGDVQFGWSTAEEQVIDSDTSYLPLENQQILDASSKADEIAQQYAACFGYSYNGSGTSLDPTADNSKLQVDLTGYDSDGNGGSLGALLSSGKIIRTDSGDIVTNQGLCSPQNLGTSNPTYGDLVFRFRLALSYLTNLDQLNNLQTVAN